MYNVNIKEAWLNTIQKESEKKASRDLLEKIAPYEESVNKDFYEMNVEERINVLSSHGYKTLMRIRQICGLLNKYLAWRCFKDGKQLLASEKVPSVQVKLKTADEWTIASEKGLYMVDRNVSHVDGNLVPVICALAWLGYKPQAMLSLTNDDVVVCDEELYIENKPVEDCFAKEIIIYYATHNSFGDDKVKIAGDKFLRKVMPPLSSRSRADLTAVNINTLIAHYNEDFSPKVVLRDLSNLGYYQRAMAYLKAHPEEKELSLSWIQANTMCKGVRAAQDFAKQFKAYEKSIKEE